jgi:hypothetical protein
MKHVFLLIVLLAAATMPPGCAAPDKTSEQSAAPSLLTEPGSPHLLFDRHIGPTVATALPARSPWPTAEAGTELHEAVVFQEHFIDRQGGTRHAHNNFYRRFSTRRVGVIAR